MILMEVIMVFEQEPIGHVVRIHPVVVFFFCFWVHKHTLYCFFKKKKEKKLKRVYEKARVTESGLYESERGNLISTFTSTVDPSHML